MTTPSVRPGVLSLRASQIREIANAALDREDVLAFWFGESDLPTPGFIRDAAARALAEGRTFYTHNLGRPSLRQALSAYLGRLHGVETPASRVAVTNSGVSALMIAGQAVLEPGDEVVVVTPVWPNIVEIPKILSTRVRTLDLRVEDGRWRLDLDELLDALHPGVRAIFLSSPNNPTGWTLPSDDRAIILEHCRRRGIWLVADDVYERLAFNPGPNAPSFLTLAHPEDRVISANSFSKAWRMTGWRLGWLVLPQTLTADVGTLLEYNTSCAPDFIQAAGEAALDHGEDSIAQMHADLAAARALVVERLSTFKGVEAAAPDAGMYAFFRIASDRASVDLAKDLIAEVGLGLAPGSAFGEKGEGWLRWCFAARPQKNANGLDRLETYLARRR